jgi:hypothetical protein
LWWWLQWQEHIARVSIQRAFTVSRRTETWNLILFDRKLVVICDLFATLYFTSRINDNLFLTFDGYDLGVAVWLLRNLKIG